MKIIKTRRLNKLLLLAPLLLGAGCTYNQRHPYTTDSSSWINPADQALVDSVRRQFNRYGDLAALSPNVQVSAQNGAVTLTGTVPTDQDRKMVDAMVARTDGVLSVNDQLVVSGPPVTAFYPSDTPLARRVKKTLQDRAETAAVAQSISVNDANGVVTLNGTVPNNDYKHSVENALAGTPGLVVLNDDLTVAPSTAVVAPPSTTLAPPAPVAPPPPSPTGRVAPTQGEIFNLHVEGLSPTDRNLAQRILDGLKTDTILAPLLPVVNINVSGGRVVLQGSVQSEAQRQAIEAAVQRAAGTDNVTDELHVQSP